MKKLLIAAALVAAAWIPVWGRADSPLETASLAWDRGDYATALKQYLEILDSPGAAAAFEPIALQTGELYRTTELTRDGEAPAFSPDSRRVAFETGSGLSRKTRIIPVGNAARVESPIELPGTGAAFSVDGLKVAYLRLPNGPNATAAQTALDNAGQADRAQRVNALNQIIAAESRVVVRELATGRESTLDTGSLRVTAVECGADAIVVTGYPPDGGAAQIYDVAEGRAPILRTTGDADKIIQARNSTGTVLTFTIRTIGGAGRSGRAGGAGAAARFGLLSLADGHTTMINGSAPAFSRDGASLAYVTRAGTEMSLMRAPTSDPSHATVVRKGPERIDAPALSPDGSRLAFQMMPKDDWEIYVINNDGSGEARVTREIQHDLLPVFLTPDRILAVIGEARHRRSYLYDLPSMKRTRLFHNNTVRTIAPEYSWTPAPDGSRIVISAERDGDTVSAQRGIHVNDLTRQVTPEELRERVKTNLDAEQALAAKGKRIFAPIASEVKTVVGAVSVSRIYGYEKALFDV